jgi:hypothetical protein
MGPRDPVIVHHVIPRIAMYSTLPGLTSSRSHCGCQGCPNIWTHPGRIHINPDAAPKGPAMACKRASRATERYPAVGGTRIICLSIST